LPSPALDVGVSKRQRILPVPVTSSHTDVPIYARRAHLSGDVLAYVPCCGTWAQIARSGVGRHWTGSVRIAAKRRFRRSSAAWSCPTAHFYARNHFQVSGLGRASWRL